MRTYKEWSFYDPTESFVAYRIRKIWWTTMAGMGPHWVYSVTKMTGWPDSSHFSTFKTAVEFVDDEIGKRY